MSASVRLKKIVDAGWEAVHETPGYLSEREARFLMTAFALVPARGANVEIGSFKGRSTVGLATVTEALNLGPITAIDPHTSPSTTDPDMKGLVSSYDEFIGNLERARVIGYVDVRKEYAHAVAETWREPIRFLWIDGDHTYEGAKADIEAFKPFLADGAVVAMHDVLGTFEGSLRVFVEEILNCDDFGAAGFNGSIGWAQHKGYKRASLRNKIQRGLLSIPTRHLIPVALRGRQLQGWDKYVYKFWRPLAPHGPVNQQRLSRQLGTRL